MTTFEIPDTVFPNLDGYTLPEDLAAIRADLKEVKEGVQQLDNYAEAKECAMRCRLKGNIPLAIRFESVAERIYGRLPTWAKW